MRLCYTARHGEKTHMKKIAIACTVVLGVLSLSAEPSAAELVARAQKGPSLLFTKERLPEIRNRIAHDPDAVSRWRTFRDHAEKEYVRRPVDIPDRGAQWYHYYNCRKCGRQLTPKSPKLHVCPACGVYNGKKVLSVTA